MKRMTTTQRLPRLFYLVQVQDRTVRTGSALSTPLAEGVEWSDGAVAVRWLGPQQSTSVSDTGLEALLEVNDRRGRTAVRWLTPPTKPPPAVRRTALSAVVPDVPAATPDGRCSLCGRPWPCFSCTEIR